MSSVNISPNAPSLEARPTTEQLLARVLAAGELADAEARKRALAEIFATTTDEERTPLLEALWALGMERDARARFAEFFGLWCESDPAAAARWASSMWDKAPYGEGERWLAKAGFAWARREFDPAFAWALTLPDARTEAGIAASILKQLAKLGDPRRALELARGVSEEFYALAANRIFAGWAENDPGAAFTALPESGKKSTLRYKLLGKWADQDPVAALKWAMAYDGLALHSMSSQVSDAGRFVATIYAAGIDWSKAMSNHPWPHGLDPLFGPLPGYLHQWLTKDSAAALAWLDGLPAGPEKLALIEAGAKRRWVDKDGVIVPSAAPLIARLSDPRMRREQAVALLARWGGADPEAALAWAATMNDPAIHEAAVAGAVAGLAGLDPDAAIAQLAGLAGEARSSAEINLAVGWAERDAAAAFKWLNATQADWAASATEDPNLHGGRVAFLAQAMKADAVGVAAWAKQAGAGSAALSLASTAILQLGDSDPRRGGGNDPVTALKMAAELNLKAQHPIYTPAMMASRFLHSVPPPPPELREFIRTSDLFSESDRATLLRPRTSATSLEEAVLGKAAEPVKN